MQPLAPRAYYEDDLSREVKQLPEFTLTLAQGPREFLLLGHIDSRADELLDRPTVCRWPANAPYVTYRAV